MIVKTFNNSDANTAMIQWINRYPELPEIGNDYLGIRNDLTSYNKYIRESYSRDYDIDMQFGIWLYNYLWKQPGFNMRIASNDDFWRYLSLKVVPNVVSERWGVDNEAHFWKRTTRIWLKQIWWFIHLTWQGDNNSTLEVIESDNFTTDVIMNLVERSGRKGYYIEVYRNISLYYSRISKKVIQQFKKGAKSKHDSLFRSLMRLNTAKVMVVDPALCMEKEKGYVEELFRDLNIKVNLDVAKSY